MPQSFCYPKFLSPWGVPQLGGGEDSTGSWLGWSTGGQSDER